MKGLLNLLTVLAALLNLTAGCGLRPSMITGQGLLNVGATLVRRRLNAGGASGTLSAMGAVLQGNSGGGLLTDISRVRTGSVGAGLETISGALGSSSATPGLRAGLAVLGAGLGGGTGGSVLTDLGKLAAQRLQNSGAITAVQSGSITTGSGIVNNGGNSALLLGQGIQPSPQATTGGFLVTAASSRSSTTSMRVHTTGNTAGNSVDLVATQGGSNPSGIASIQGNRPTFIAPVTEVPGGAAPGAGPGVSMPGALGGLPGGGLLGGLSSTSRLSTSTVSISGRNTALGVGRPQQQIRHPIGGGSLGTGGVATNAATVSAAVTTANLAGGVGGVLMGIAPSTNGGATPPSAPSRVGGLSSSTPGLGGLETVPGTRPGVGLPGAGGIVGISTSGLHGAGSTILGLPGSSHPGSGRGILPEQGLGPGTPQNGQPLGGTITGSASTLLSTASMATQTTRTTAGRIVGVDRSLTNGPHIHPAERPGQGAQQNEAALSETIIGGGSANMPSPAVLGTQVLGHTTGRLLAVGSSLTAGISGVGAPNRGITPGPSAAGHGTLPTQGVVPGAQPNSQLLGDTIGSSTATLVSTAARGTDMAGSSAGRLLGVGSTFPNGAPMEGAGPSPIGGGSGIEIRQTLGQAAQQAQGFMRAGSSTRQSTTVTQTELAGGSPGSGFLAGVSPEQGSLPGTQPGSQAQGGVSHLTVSTSSQSTSSWRAQAHVVGGSSGNSGGAFPSIGGHGSGGVPIVTPGSGTTIVGAGSRLMHAIVGTTSGAHPPGGSGPVVPGGYGVISSGGGSASVSSGMISGVPQLGQKPHRRNPSAATAAGLALGTMAGAIAITAIGTAIGSALQNGRAGGGRRISGCSGGSGCHSGCGRRRRSVPLSKVPAEVLNEIPTNFERLY